MRTKKLPALRIGVGGPVGSGKTTLLEMLCKAMRDRYDLVAITNDIYTKEDATFLIRRGAQTAHLLVTRFDPVMTGFRAALLALRTPARMVIVPGELGAERSFMVKAWIMQPGLGVLPGCRLSRFIGR